MEGKRKSVMEEQKRRWYKNAILRILKKRRKIWKKNRKINTRKEKTYETNRYTNGKEKEKKKVKINLNIEPENLNEI